MGKEIADTIQTTDKEGVVEGCVISGTQFYQQDRVYDGDIALAQPADLPGGSYKYMQDLRIRKLTEREVFRLQGVKGEDFEKISKSISKSLLYHLAGDSIEVSCLMAIFGMMLDVDWKRKIDDLIEDICEVESPTDTRIYENGKIIKE